VILAFLPHYDRPFGFQYGFMVYSGKDLLLERFGNEYQSSCREVNRSIPTRKQIENAFEFLLENLSGKLIQTERASLHLSCSGLGDFWVMKEVLMKSLNPWD